jgi:hypothetical protein
MSATIKMNAFTDLHVFRKFHREQQTRREKPLNLVLIQEAQSRISRSIAINYGTRHPLSGKYRPGRHPPEGMKHI